MKDGRSQETGVRSQNKVGAGFEENIVLMSKILLNPSPILPMHNRYSGVVEALMWGRVYLIYRSMSIFLVEPAPTTPTGYRSIFPATVSYHVRWYRLCKQGQARCPQTQGEFYRKFKLFRG